MKTLKRRGLLAKAGALLAVAALAFSASPAYAEDPVTPPSTSDVTITKLVQPDTKGTSTTGKENTSHGGDPIKGVTFEAYEVPITGADDSPLDPGTNAWQVAIATMDLTTAQGKIDTKNADHSGITGDTGTVNWSDVDYGLYLIKETATPSGVVAAGDFLLAVPTANPDGGWLEHIYVYPKGASVTGSAEVSNAPQYVIGDIITWTIKARIPQIRDPFTGDFQATDHFSITDSYDPTKLEDVGVQVEGITIEAGKTASDYYVVSYGTEAEAGKVTVTFTELGLQTLADNLATTKEVTVKIDTVVLATGAHTNKPSFQPSSDLDTKVDLLERTVKYGNYNLTVTGTDDAKVEGAEFRVYLTEEAAKAKGDTVYDPVDNPDGYLVPTGDAKGKFVTDTDGKVSLGGLRDSFWADGVSFNNEDPKYQKYWFAQISAPDGQQLLAEPVEFEISGENTQQPLTTPSTSNAFVLPLTGGSGTALLTILGLGILAIVLFVARSRRNAEV